MPNPTNTAYSVNIIADLKTLTGAFNDETILLLGYYSINDDGGGEFYWDNASVATDDGGSVIQATGITTGRWIRVITENLVNVKWFGAKGDGSNASTMFTNCFAFCTTALITNVTVPQGNYGISEVSIPSNINLSGGGTIQQYTSQQVCFYIDGKSNIAISGLLFTGIASDYTNTEKDDILAKSDGILIRGATASNNIVISQCSFTNFGYCSIDSIYCNNLTIENCICIGPGSPTIPTGGNFNFGIHTYTGSNVSINNTSISNCAQGIYLGPTLSNASVYYNNISNIVGQHGIYASYGDNLTITGNKISGCNYCGMKVQLQYVASDLDGYNVLISGNTVDTVGSHGILVYNVDYSTDSKILHRVVIADNIINRPGATSDSCIYLAQTDNFSIIGNVTEGGVNGIDLRQLTNGFVTANRVNNCQGNGIIVSVATASNISLVHNEIINAAQGQIASNECGIQLAAGDTISLYYNRVSATSSSTATVIFPLLVADVSNLQETLVLVGNRFDVGSVRLSTPTSRTIQRFEDNEAVGYYLNNYPAGPYIGSVGTNFTSSFDNTSTLYPVGKSFLVTDKIYNPAPVAGGALGWICITKGKYHGISVGDLTNASTNIANVTTATIGSWAAGDPISGTGIPSNTTVTFVGTNYLTISHAATATIAANPLFEAQFEMFAPISLNGVF